MVHDMRLYHPAVCLFSRHNISDTSLDRFHSLYSLVYTDKQHYVHNYLANPHAVFNPLASDAQEMIRVGASTCQIFTLRTGVGRMASGSRPR
jgi:hypothetical protein